MVSEYNVQERFDTKEETWPLDQPRNFIPLHYHGKYITKETTEIANKNIELVSTLGLLVELVIILSLLYLSPEQHSRQTRTPFPWSYSQLVLRFVIPINAPLTDTNPGNIFKTETSRKYYNHS